MKYTITVNEKQLELIDGAVKCYLRLNMGQLDMALDMVKTDTIVNVNDPILLMLKKALFPELTSLGASYGIGNEERPIIGDLYMIYQGIHYFLSDKPQMVLQTGTEPEVKVEKQ